MMAISASCGVVCAVGDAGAAHLYQPDAAPLRLSLPGRPRLFAVALHGSTLGYAVGERGEIWRWVGRSWEALPPFTAADLCAVAIVAPGDILVGTADGCLWRTDGNGRPVSFADLRPGPGEARPAAPVRALLTLGSGDIWAATGSAIFRLSGARQSERWALPEGCEVAALCAPPAAAGVAPVVAVGRGGAWRLYRGGTGTAERIAGPGESFTAATCGPDGSLYAVVQAPDGEDEDDGPGELRAWERGQWRTLLRAPGPLRGVALGEGGALWLAGTVGRRRSAVFCHRPADAADVAAPAQPAELGEATRAARPRRTVLATGAALALLTLGGCGEGCGGVGPLPVPESPTWPTLPTRPPLTPPSIPPARLQRLAPAPIEVPDPGRSGGPLVQSLRPGKAGVPVAVGTR